MTNNVLTGVILDEQLLTIDELSQVSFTQKTWIIELVNEGIIFPQGDIISNWRFSGRCLERVQIAKRLEKDLGVNISGAALVIELLEENKRLKKEIENKIIESMTYSPRE
tara:strand:- start:5988 stop:6317 length:330 start_codon:yes stop_codon:yes gene_type:complete